MLKERIYDKVLVHEYSWTLHDDPSEQQWKNIHIDLWE